MRKRGFTLLETLLALMVFSLAVVALVEAVHQLGGTTLLMRREAEVQERIRSLLIEHTRLPDPQEEAQVKEGATVFSTSTRNFPNRRGKNVAATHHIVLRVTLKAKPLWKNSVEAFMFEVRNDTPVKSV